MNITRRGLELRTENCRQRFWEFYCNVGKTIINHLFGNGLYHLFMVIWGMVYDCSNHITSSLGKRSERFFGDLNPEIVLNWAHHPRH